jgi:hypothetical protein
MKVTKIMRLNPRHGQPEKKEIGGFQEEDWGYRVRGIDGEDLGYFGADKYASISFEARWIEDLSPH